MASFFLFDASTTARTLTSGEFGFIGLAIGERARRRRRRGLQVAVIVADAPAAPSGADGVGRL